MADKLVQEFLSKVLPAAMTAQAESIAAIFGLKQEVTELIDAVTAKSAERIELHQKGVRAAAATAGKSVASIDKALAAMDGFSDQPGFESQMKTLDSYTGSLESAKKQIEALLKAAATAQTKAEAAAKALGKAGKTIEVEWAQIQAGARDQRKSATARADELDVLVGKAGAAASSGNAKELEALRKKSGGLASIFEGLGRGLLRDQLKLFDASLKSRHPSADFLGQYKSEKPKVEADLAAADVAVARAAASRKVLDSLKVKELDVRKIAEAIGVAVVDAAKLVPFLGAGDSALLKALENLIKTRKLDNTPKGMLAGLKKIKVI
jgi:hypothetical protein